jgi:urease accessory protein
VHGMRYTGPMTMDAAVRTALAAGPATGWAAALELGFARVGERTALVGREHRGPLRVQKPLYPEGPGVCQVVVVHPPGGIVGGDTLALALDVAAGAFAQVTTPGATKWYRSAGPVASADTAFVVGEGATLEWLPQEAIVFDGARAAIATRIALAAGARYIGWDVVCLGRTAAGERFAQGRVRQSLEIRAGTELLFAERAVIDGGSALLHSGAVLGGAPVFGTLVAAGAPVGDDTLAACRAIACTEGDGAVTRLPGAFVARYRGGSATAARTYLAKLWAVLRPALAGREAVPPRIWST